jgi:hypothetical protein
VKDRAGRDRKLAATFDGFAAPHLAAGKAVEIGADTFGAESFPAVSGEPDSLEGVLCLLIRKAQHLGQTEGPGLCAEKEVLRHLLSQVIGIC